MKVIWSITSLIVLLHTFASGCNIDDLRRNSHILLRNAAKDFSITSNSVLHVMCVTTDDKIVHAKVKCSTLSEWEIPPSCLRNCAPLEVPKNVKIQYSVPTGGPYGPGVTATVSCTSSGFFIYGSDTLTCTSSGFWSGSVPQCVDYVEMFVHYGENVTLTCAPSVSNHCQLVNWFFEDTMVQSQNFPQLTVHRNTLHITRVNEISIGRYVCACISLDTETAPIMTIDVNLPKKRQNTLLILIQKNGGGGSNPKRNHEKHPKRPRHFKSKNRNKHKKSTSTLIS